MVLDVADARWPWTQGCLRLDRARPAVSEEKAGWPCLGDEIAVGTVRSKAKLPHVGKRGVVVLSAEHHDMPCQVRIGLEDVWLYGDEMAPVDLDEIRARVDGESAYLQFRGAAGDAVECQWAWASTTLWHAASAPRCLDGVWELGPVALGPVDVRIGVNGAWRSTSLDEAVGRGPWVAEVHDAPTLPSETSADTPEDVSEPEASAADLAETAAEAQVTKRNDDTAVVKRAAARAPRVGWGFGWLEPELPTEAMVTAEPKLPRHGDEVVVVAARSEANLPYVGKKGLVVLSAHEDDDMPYQIRIGLETIWLYGDEVALTEAALLAYLPKIHTRLDGVPVMVASSKICWPDGSIQSINPAAERLLRSLASDSVRPG